MVGDRAARHRGVGRARASCRRRGRGGAAGRGAGRGRCLRRRLCRNGSGSRTTTSPPSSTWPRPGHGRRGPVPTPPSGSTSASLPPTSSTRPGAGCSATPPISCIEASGALVATLKATALEHRSTAMVGRTHGVHAEPTTFGFKVALWCLQADRDRARLRAARAGGGRRQAVGSGRDVLERRSGGRAPRVRGARSDARAGDPGHRPRSPRGVPVVLRVGRRDGRADRGRAASPAAHRGAGGRRRASSGRPEGLLGHAAQAQPDHR